MLLLIAALMVPFLVVVANPLFLWLQTLMVQPKKSEPSGEADALSVSLVTVVRTPDFGLLDAKIENVRQLEGLDQWILYHDGPASHVLKDYIRRRHGKVQFLETSTRKGKNAVLNDALQQCTGDIIVFSDTDSLLQTHCISLLKKHFHDQAVGGVCGQRVIGEQSRKDSGQRLFINLDSRIKQWESVLGQLTSNDGKFYAVRKSLLGAVPDGVTDDLYNGLAVLRQKQKLIFDEALTARIKLPSRSLAHEVQRRRRIVCRSLRGLWLHKRIFNGFEYGLLSVRLFINKVLRRFIPHALLVSLLAFNALLFSVSFSYATIFIIQLLCLVGLLVFTRGDWEARTPESLYRLLFAVAYVAAGLYGTLLGTLDVLRGEKYVTWTPKKS